MVRSQPRYLTLQEVAEILRLEVPTARHLLATGEIPGGFQIGARGLWRVGAEDVNAWIERRQQVAREAHPDGRS